MCHGLLRSPHFRLVPNQGLGRRWWRLSGLEPPVEGPDRVSPKRLGPRTSPALEDNSAVPAAVSKPKVVIITGATAVGKTATSLALADILGGEIISADSVQVYRGLDIGSDKVSESERRGIPHHLIDILPTTSDFSAGDFYTLARKATAEILQRGRVPIVVGGTGFYLRWFVHGPPRTPRSTPDTHARAQALLEGEWAAAEERAGEPLTPEQRWDVATSVVARAGDPASAERLKEVPNNLYRLYRVLEIVLETGRTLAEQDLDKSAPLDYDFRCFFLNRPRIELYRRIDERCEQMVARGLLQEAVGLLEEGIGLEQTCASRGIGYRQAMQALSTWLADPHSISGDSLEEMVRAIQTASRKLCHRQLSWFRDEALYRWMDAARPPEEVAADIASLLRQDTHDAGSVAQRGVLSKEEQKALKGYTSQLGLIGAGPERERVLCWIRSAFAARRPLAMPDPPLHTG